MIQLGDSSVFHIFTKEFSRRREVVMNDGKNFFIWLVLMLFLFIGLQLLETFLEVPQANI